MSNEIMSLSSGYARTKKAQAEVKQYRRMTVEEAKSLSYGDHVPFLDNRGQVRELKINGKPQTWKTRPKEVRVPYKYGFRETGSLWHQYDGTMDRLLVEVG
jgi:hypothetical protein